MAGHQLRLAAAGSLAAGSSCKSRLASCLGSAARPCRQPPPPLPFTSYCAAVGASSPCLAATKPVFLAWVHCHRAQQRCSALAA